MTIYDALIWIFWKTCLNLTSLLVFKEMDTFEKEINILAGGNPLFVKFNTFEAEFILAFYFQIYFN